MDLLHDVHLVIFDMDGVLFDTERLALDAWEEAARRHGECIPRALAAETIGLSAEGTRDVYRRRLGDGFPYEAVLGERLRIGREQVARGGPEKPGIRPLLDFLDAHGITAAVATSTGARRAQHLLDTADLTARFRSVVTGDMVHHTKPAPDLFLEAASRAGVLPPHCLVLEDSDYGIRAAHAAGMASVFVRDIKVPSPDVMAHTCAQFKSLSGFLGQCRASG